MEGNIWPQTTEALICQAPEFASMYDQIKASNLPKYQGARILAPSNLNIQQWRAALDKYHDSIFVIFVTSRIHHHGSEQRSPYTGIHW